ncbi:MFS transporter [Novosphingobium aquimarinum]|uniref:MFS transporter n=1 Tax=Novosphingobium aquimarinum TaxID=2682494 RepID=UPI0012EC426D|nr:MFS transporter [Novosphingobium aquimarinum]
MADTAPPSPFSISIYRSFWIANLCSHLGYVIQSVGAAWLMTRIAPTPKMVALVQTSITLPMMMLAFFSGAVADSFDRRKILIAAQIFMFATAIVLCLLAYAEAITPWLLLACTFAIGCGMAINNPAWQANVGDIVPKPVLPAAVAYNSIAFNVARSGGPAIGGVLVAAAGSAAAFAVNAVSYTALLAVLLRWKREVPERKLPAEGVLQGMGDGLRYFAMSPQIFRTVLRSLLFGLASSATGALMPIIARELLGGGATVYGLILGAFGVGAVAGAFTVTRLRARFRVEQILFLASLAVACGAAVTATSGFLALTCVSLAITGGGWILGVSTMNVAVQLASPRWVVARMIAIQQTGFFGGMALGSFLFGIIATRFDVTTALLVSSAAQLLVMASARILPVADAADVDLDPGDWSAPSPAIAIEGRSGPIAVSVAYQVAHDDIPAFLAEMRDWRRLRLRDGARRWQLYRDLASPETWLETYRVATWTEYARHNLRRTQADMELQERILTLQIGGRRPQVSRMLEVSPDSAAVQAARRETLPTMPVPDISG